MHIHTSTCLLLFANWRPLALCKLSTLISQQAFLFCKQTCLSLQYFVGKPTDGISCVPQRIVKGSRHETQQQLQLTKMTRVQQQQCLQKHIC